MIVLTLAASFSAQASASVVLYGGSDPGVGPGGARPNSDAAAASFDAAAGSLGTVNRIDFESTPLGVFTSQVVAPGVTATLTNSEGGIFRGGTTTQGYNTTVNGSQQLFVAPPTSGSIGDVTEVAFTFATPIQAFGAYLTGVGTQLATLSAVFNDGTSQSITITGSASGGVQFFGFTDVGRSISRVGFRSVRGDIQTRDNFGMDDVRYVGATAVVPEPLPLVQCGAALLAGLGYRVGRRLRKRG